MQSFTSPNHDQTEQNHLHSCDTMEVQAFQLLVLRDFLHRRHEAWFIKKDVEKTVHNIPSNKLLLEVKKKKMELTKMLPNRQETQKSSRCELCHLSYHGIPEE